MRQPFALCADQDDSPAWPRRQRLLRAHRGPMRRQVAFQAASLAYARRRRSSSLVIIQLDGQTGQKHLTNRSDALPGP